jgi:hypothetical protein
MDKFSGERMGMPDEWMEKNYNISKRSPAISFFLSDRRTLDEGEPPSGRFCANGETPMKSEIRLVKAILTAADAGVLCFCLLLSADQGFQKFIFSALNEIPLVSSIFSTPLPSIPSPEFSSTETGLAFAVAVGVPTATGLPTEGAGWETVKTDIPVFPDWIPMQYSFAYPDLSEEDFVYFGDHDLQSERENFLLQGYPEFISLNPKEVKEGVRIFYLNKDYSKKLFMTFEQYLLSSTRKLVLKQKEQNAEETDGVVCVGASPMQVGTPYTFCFLQMDNRLIVAHGPEAEYARGFLVDFRAGSYTNNYNDYFPAYLQLSALEAQVQLADCSMRNDEEWYKNTSAGEDEQRVVFPVDIITINAWLVCHLHEPDLPGLHLSVLSVETRWMMDRLINLGYEAQIKDFELRRITDTHLLQEGPLLVRYYERNSITVFKQNGNSVLALGVSYQNYAKLVKKPLEFGEFLELVKQMALGLHYPEIDIADLGNISSMGSGVYFLSSLAQTW